MGCHVHPSLNVGNSSTEESHLLGVYFLSEGIKPGRSGIYSLKGTFFIGFRHLSRWGVHVSLCGHSSQSDDIVGSLECFRDLKSALDRGKPLRAIVQSLCGIVGQRPRARGSAKVTACDEWVNGLHCGFVGFFVLVDGQVVACQGQTNECCQKSGEGGITCPRNGLLEKLNCFFDTVYTFECIRDDCRGRQSQGSQRCARDDFTQAQCLRNSLG